MKIAVIGSRSLQISNIKEYIPEGRQKSFPVGRRESTCAPGLMQKETAWFSQNFYQNIKSTERAAPLRRNLQIIAYADSVIAIWDGKSKGTAYVIEQCKKTEQTDKGL